MSDKPTAGERLALSRERLRQALQQPPQPGVGAAVAAGWAQHPQHLAFKVAADAAKAVMHPIAQRHPLGLVATAMVLGGLLAWSRPLRGLLTPALLAGVLPPLVNKALASVPATSWMAVLGSLARE